MKGGLQASRAGKLCQNPRFCLYLDQRRRKKNAMEWHELPDGTHTPEDAADFVRQACGIQSRRELDSNDTACAMLNKIVADYSNWERQQRSGGAA
jgi:hypothetical protein